MRAGSIPQGLLGGLASSILLACGGDDLLLPSSGVPANLRLVSGDLQQAEAGTDLPDPLVVEATDAEGRPVAGSRIVFRFEIMVQGGRVSPDTAETDELGLAAGEAEEPAMTTATATTRMTTARRTGRGGRVKGKGKGKGKGGGSGDDD